MADSLWSQQTQGFIQHFWFGGGKESALWCFIEWGEGGGVVWYSQMELLLNQKGTEDPSQLLEISNME